MSGDHNMHQKSKGSKKGLFDDVPLVNPDRDKAWEAFIKRRDVKAMMKGKEDFKCVVISLLIFLIHGFFLLLLSNLQQNLHAKPSPKRYTTGHMTHQLGT